MCSGSALLQRYVGLGRYRETSKLVRPPPPPPGTIKGDTAELENRDLTSVLRGGGLASGLTLPADGAAGTHTYPRDTFVLVKHLGGWRNKSQAVDGQ